MLHTIERFMQQGQMESKRVLGIFKWHNLRCLIVLFSWGVVYSTGAVAEGGPFDGIYKGTSTRTRGNDTFCGNDVSRPAVITVRDNKFQRVWNKNLHIVITVEIAQDGTMIGIERWGTRGSIASARGRIIGPNMEVEFNGEWCTYQIILKKKSHLPGE